MGLWGSFANSLFTAGVPSAGSPTRGPDLAITMLRSGTDPRGVIVAGSVVTISIGVNNQRGDTEAHGSTLAVTLPTALKLQQARPAPNTTEPAKAEAVRLVWNLGTVAAGAFPRIFELDLTVPAEAQVGTELHVSATVRTIDNDTNHANDSATYVLRVDPAVAHLHVSSSLDSVPLTVAEPVEFSAGATNWGTVTASGSTLMLTLPPKVLLKSSDPPPNRTSDNSYTWKFGDIKPAETRLAAISATLDNSLAPPANGATSGAVLTFKLEASTTTTSVDLTNSHLEITKPVERAGADLKVWLTVLGTHEPGELPTGEDVTYTILYGNFGNRPASGASVSLSLAGGLNLLSTQPVHTHISQSDKFAGGVLSWNVGDVRVGESKLINCRVHIASVPKGGSVVKAAISFPGTDITPANNVAYSHLYAPRAVSGIRPLGPLKRHVWTYLLWTVVLVLLVGILLLALRATKARARS